MRGVIATVVGVLLLLGSPAATAAPGDGSGSALTNSDEGAALKAWRGKQAKQNKPGRSGGNPSKVRTPGESDAEQRKRVARQSEKFVAYYLRKQAYDACRGSGQGGCTAPGKAVEQPELIARAQLLGGGAPQISPQQAAIIAVARLRLSPPEPVVGPSPEINEWDIAAVGYPYWLWAEGDLDPAPVSTTVADLTVSLDAHLASTTFDLGDGTRVTCTDLTARWSRAVEPGAASPACGHTYTKPSLPKGDYTITAYSTWAVDWSVNGVGGTIPLYQQASTTLPVGELQVLTR